VTFTAKMIRTKLIGHDEKNILHFGHG